MFFLIMTLSVSFAADNDTGGDVTITKNQDSGYGGAANNVKTNDETFTQLSSQINKSGNTLALNKNYKFSSKDDSSGIVIKTYILRD